MSPGGLQLLDAREQHRRGAATVEHVRLDEFGLHLRTQSLVERSTRFEIVGKKRLLDVMGNKTAGCVEEVSPQLFITFWRVAPVDETERG